MRGHFSDGICPKQEFIYFKNYQNRSKFNQNMRKWAKITILDYVLKTDHIKAVNIYFWSIFNAFEGLSLKNIVVLAKYELLAPYQGHQITQNTNKSLQNILKSTYFRIFLVLWPILVGVNPSFPAQNSYGIRH